MSVDSERNPDAKESTMKKLTRRLARFPVWGSLCVALAFLPNVAAGDGWALAAVLSNLVAAAVWAAC
jgi:hypothetical protein